VTGRWASAALLLLLLLPGERRSVIEFDRVLLYM
jgi:hypothetical protein